MANKWPPPGLWVERIIVHDNTWNDYQYVCAACKELAPVRYFQYRSRFSMPSAGQPLCQTCGDTLYAMQQLRHLTGEAR